MTRSFPPIANHFTRVPVPPPYIHRGAKVHSFPVRADRAVLQKLCDAWFDQVSQGQVRYQVLLPRIFVLVANISEIQPGDPIYADLGKTSEVDVGLWLLVLRTKPLSLTPRWLPVRLFVDSSDAVVVGREVYGFQKEMGRCQVPPTTPSPDPFNVKAYVTEHPGATMQWRDVLDIRAVTPAASVPSAQWTTAEEAVEALRQCVLGDDEFHTMDAQTQSALSHGFSANQLPFLFLRQFMAIEQPQGACYQAIVEADSRLLAFRRGGFTSWEYSLTVTSYLTHPFDRFLGLASGQHDIGRGIWAEFDFAMEGGTPIFIA